MLYLIDQMLQEGAHGKAREANYQTLEMIRASFQSMIKPGWVSF